jgi:hypothetical protein
MTQMTQISADGKDRYYDVSPPAAMMTGTVDSLRSFGRFFDAVFQDKEQQHGDVHGPRDRVAVVAGLPSVAGGGRDFCTSDRRDGGGC